MQKAVEAAGSQKKLARLLRVPLVDLEKWIAGKDQPPMAVFLKAVDLVLDDTTSAASEPGEPPAPRDCTTVI